MSQLIQQTPSIAERAEKFANRLLPDTSLNHHPSEDVRTARILLAGIAAFARMDRQLIRSSLKSRTEPLFDHCVFVGRLKTTDNPETVKVIQRLSCFNRSKRAAFERAHKLALQAFESQGGRITE
jgi:hypothetical protein